MTRATQGREEGRWESFSNDCCCEDSAVGADYITPKRVPCEGDISFKTVHGSRCKVDLGTFLDK